LFLGTLGDIDWLDRGGKFTRAVDKADRRRLRTLNNKNWRFDGRKRAFYENSKVCRRQLLLFVLARFDVKMATN